jgi:tellurite methyltransferase
VHVSTDLRKAFGDIDIYLFDQLLKGRFDNRPRILDAGCGDGRNLRYLLRHGCNCHGIDRDAGGVNRVRELAEAAGLDDLASRFVVGEVDRLPWPAASMDAVICSAVLHFADDAAHFHRMVDELWRVLAPGGLLFARLASTIGIEGLVGPGGRRVRLPDGSDRFVVDEELLMACTGRFGARLADPIKTTVVQGMRAMTTLCLFRP